MRPKRPVWVEKFSKKPAAAFQKKTTPRSRAPGADSSAVATASTPPPREFARAYLSNNNRTRSENHNPLNIRSLLALRRLIPGAENLALARGGDAKRTSRPRCFTRPSGFARRQRGARRHRGRQRGRGRGPHPVWHKLSPSSRSDDARIQQRHDERACKTIINHRRRTGCWTAFEFHFFIFHIIMFVRCIILGQKTHTFVRRSHNAMDATSHEGRFCLMRIFSRLCLFETARARHYDARVVGLVFLGRLELID